MASHRDRDGKQSAALRRITLWVPDTRAPGFAKECRRQSLLIAKRESGNRSLDFLDKAARDIEGWTGIA